MGYRAFTWKAACALNVEGWVRNLEDGRVEALAVAPVAVLDQFESRLREGPATGEVDAVVVRPWPVTEPLTGFQIRKDGAKPCCES